MKTIFIGLNWLGDIIMSLPAITSTLEISEVHMVTRPHLAEIYSLLSSKIHIYPIDTKTNLFSILKATKPLRDLKAEKAIIFPDSFRSALIGRLCKAGETYGFKSQFRSNLLSHRISKPDNFKLIHESDIHFMLAHAANPAITRTPLRKAELPVSIIRQLIDKYGNILANQYIVFAPGAAFGPAKRWPPQRFAQLANLIDAHYHCPVVITGTSAETDIALEIKNECKAKILDLTGQTSMSELLSLLANARALVANDSGTMHLTALTLTPTIVPVGPTDMRRTGPLNPNCHTIISTACPIAPCRKKVCPLGHHQCMLAISADQVMQKLIETEKN